MKKILLILACSFVNCCMGYADSINPELRVLLFKTQAAVQIRGDSALIIGNPGFKIIERKGATVEWLGGQKWSINGRVVHQPALSVNAEGKIWIQKPSSSAARAYWGQLELRPETGQLLVINKVPIETYLEGVLNAEISTDWPLESVKAQAVVARTFALYLKERHPLRPWHLSANPVDQVYQGAGIIDQRGLAAIQQTRGIVVTFGQKLAQTFYHSNCGGMTEVPEALWGKRVPYLKVRSIPYGKSDPRFNWSLYLSNQGVKNLLNSAGVAIDRITRVSIVEYTSSGRVSQLLFEGTTTAKLTAKKLRQLIGYQRMQSLLFNVIRVPGGFYFKGRGNGHGVGLSQWSAKEMAEVGYNYQEILNFFYQGTRLKRIDQLGIN